ncbi:MAG: 5-(carboxyamino)imidazole ribonucleotide synthase [Bacilli bacterium]
MTRTTIGILGAGQLAQMTCLAGRELGFSMHVYASHALEPAALVADRVCVGDLRDLNRLREFAQGVSVVTYDTELLPIQSVRLISQYTRVAPDPQVLFIAQNRERERRFLIEQGIETPRVAFVQSERDLVAAVSRVGIPAVLKTLEQGYDGKGQAQVRSETDAQDAWRALGGVPCVLEEWLDSPLEMSVIVAGGVNGELRSYPVIDNEHRRHILHRSTAPSSLPAEVQRKATAIAERVARSLSLTGLLTVEMFYAADGRVLVNELAPRPHNSGHHTQLSAATNQFEQLLRAVSGLPMGATNHLPATMINLLGDLFVHTDDHSYRRQGFVYADHPAVNVYYYGKSEARPGRKMGHLIALADTVDEAMEKAAELYGTFENARTY